MKLHPDFPDALAIINVIIVFVLACITAWYAWSANRQAKAAEKQAIAARAQAEYAESTLKFFQGQVEEQTRIAILTLVGCIQELRQAADDWYRRLEPWGAITETTDVRLLPNEWAISLERAKDIPPSLYQQLQKLQKSSRTVSRNIEHFSAMGAAYRSQMQADQIRTSLATLISECTTVFNKLGPLLPADLINGYVDQ